MTTFPNVALPLRIRETIESFVIEDTAGQLVGAIYYDEGDEIRRQVRKRISRDEAMAIAQACARAVTGMEEAGKGP